MLTELLVWRLWIMTQTEVVNQLSSTYTHISLFFFLFTKVIFFFFKSLNLFQHSEWGKSFGHFYFNKIVKTLDREETFTQGFILKLFL